MAFMSQPHNNNTSAINNNNNNNNNAVTKNTEGVISKIVHINASNWPTVV